MALRYISYVSVLLVRPTSGYLNDRFWWNLVVDMLEVKPKLVLLRFYGNLLGDDVILWDYKFFLFSSYFSVNLTCQWELRDGDLICCTSFLVTKKFWIDYFWKHTIFMQSSWLYIFLCYSWFNNVWKRIKRRNEG